jgi:hypothetical protein
MDLPQAPVNRREEQKSPRLIDGRIPSRASRNDTPVTEGRWSGAHAFFQEEGIAFPALPGRFRVNRVAAPTAFGSNSLKADSRAETRCAKSMARPCVARRKVERANVKAASMYQTSGVEH